MTHPILTCRLADRSVYIDTIQKQYVGIAADNAHVLIGNVGMEDQTERYLKTHPTPDTW